MAKTINTPCLGITINSPIGELNIDFFSPTMILIDRREEFVWGEEVLKRLFVCLSREEGEWDIHWMHGYRHNEKTDRWYKVTSALKRNGTLQDILINAIEQVWEKEEIMNLRSRELAQELPHLQGSLECRRSLSKYIEGRQLKEPEIKGAEIKIKQIEDRIRKTKKRGFFPGSFARGRKVGREFSPRSFGSF